ncbi:hypothetical protein ABZ671_23470 [Micromonospora sp. NPDC006766]|uniref:hypothetical protein n=1 Tax=Micromonospora sp. NPDC006766 TaxID=3154778 RepID=UPI0033D69709
MMTSSRAHSGSRRRRFFLAGAVARLAWREDDFDARPGDGRPAFGGAYDTA